MGFAWPGFLDSDGHSQSESHLHSCVVTARAGLNEVPGTCLGSGCHRICFHCSFSIYCVKNEGKGGTSDLLRMGKCHLVFPFSIVCVRACVSVCACTCAGWGRCRRRGGSDRRVEAKMLAQDTRGHLWGQ